MRVEAAFGRLARMTPKIKRLDAAALHELAERAAAAPRRRKNLNLHESLGDPVQRLLNGFEPGTYVRPHRHRDKWELFVLLQGAAAVLTFEDDGRVLERAELNAGDGARVVEIPEATWHTLVSLMPGTVLFEVKRGPYGGPAAAEFASWAPAEGEADAAAFERRLRAAQAGASLGR